MHRSCNDREWYTHLDGIFGAEIQNDIDPNISVRVQVQVQLLG